MKSLKVLVPILVLALIFIGCGQKAGEIKLNTSSVTLKVAGGTAKLTATVYDTNGNVIPDPKQPISWTTSNPEVATVENGMVKAMGSGTASVTANIAGLSASANVNVQIVSSVILTPPIQTINKGDSFQFNAVVKDEKNKKLEIPITWKIGNAKVASVNAAGKVTGVAEGKTVVKAVAGDKMGKASITVIEAEPDKDSKVGGVKKKGEEKKVKKAAGLKKKKK